MIMTAQEPRAQPKIRIAPRFLPEEFASHRRIWRFRRQVTFVLFRRLLLWPPRNHSGRPGHAVPRFMCDIAALWADLISSKGIDAAGPLAPRPVAIGNGSAVGGPRLGGCLGNRGMALCRRDRAAS